MSTWRIVGGPRAYEPSGARSERGWAYDVEGERGRRTVKVEVVGILEAGGGRLPDEVELAFSTEGRSAVHAVLGDDDPPERLIVTPAGVHADVRIGDD